jgi:hypothetical protein
MRLCDEMHGVCAVAHYLTECNSLVVLRYLLMAAGVSNLCCPLRSHGVLLSAAQQQQRQVATASVTAVHVCHYTACVLHCAVLCTATQRCTQ